MLLLAQVAPGTAGPEQTKKELEAARDKVRELEREADAARGELDRLQAEIQVLVTRIQQAKFHLYAVRDQIAGIDAAIDRRKRRIGELQDRLNERARSVYMAGPAGPLQLVLEADSMTDLTNRLSYLEVLQQADSDTAVGLEVEKEELTRQRSDMKDVEAEQERLVTKLERQNAQLQSKFSQQQAITEELEAKKREAEDLVDKLQKKYQRELAAQIAAAASAAIPAAGPPLSADGPFYWCPVDRPRSYIDDFGFPRVGHTHQGNDIFAPYDTPIRAPFDGVARESSNSLGGLSVHVYAPNGDYVYNAHLSRFAGVNGQQVKAGELVGYVGTSGNAQGTSPHDHFEYHPGGGGAVSPYVYLNEVCGVGGAG